MSDLMRRAQEARRLTANESVPKWRRLAQAFQSFSGLELTVIPPEVRKRFEADIVAVNGVLGRYPLQTVEDYQSIGDVDLQQMLDMVDAAAARAIRAGLDRIVADLDAGVKKLPVEAIREAREHRDLMVPRLIEVLREATSAARVGDTPEGNAHFFALFLLTEFRAEEALTAILGAISLPGELPFDLFGDAVTSTLPRVLAFFAGDRPEVMDSLIDDRALNQYVRWEAAQSYVHLVRDGRLQRDDAVRRLRQHLRRAIDRDDVSVIGGLICVLVSFAPKEALEEIKEAYQRDLVDPGLVDFGTVERSIAEGENRVRKELDWCGPTGIEDTIEELRHWAAFKEEAPQPLAVRPPRPLFGSSTERVQPATVATSSGNPCVRRNQLCPCGSGKKFKKCCGVRK